MAHMTLLAYPNCSVSSFGLPIDSFAIANMWRAFHGKTPEDREPLFSWDVITIDGKPVNAFGGIPISPNGSVADIAETDFILIPGFLPPLDFLGKVPAALSDWLRRQHDRGTMIGTVCTGTFLLADIGLLDGRTATTNWAYADFFRKCYPEVRLKPERILTVDGNLVCSGATSALVELCLYLIETFGSPDLAASCSKLMLVDSNRKSQMPYVVFEFQKDHADEKILQAQEYMEQHFSSPVSMDSVASDLCMSPRHFKRRFKNATGDTPQTYLQRLRIEEAKQKLETTLDSFDEITWKVGYESSNSFRRLFKKYTGLSPREYKDRFSRVEKRYA